MKQYFHIYRLTNGNDREATNADVNKWIDEGWYIKQMENIPSNVEGNNTKFAASLAILFEKDNKNEID